MQRPGDGRGVSRRRATPRRQADASNAARSQDSRQSGDRPRPRHPARGPAAAGKRPGRARTERSGPSRRLIAASLVAVTLVAIGAALALGSLGAGADDRGATAGAGQTFAGGTPVEARGGHWTNFGPDVLAALLVHKDFTFVNVKTPYVGEIAGTDLYLPYDQLAARARELPADHSSRILVYCRSGNESAVAAQTLLDLGYTNVANLAGGMQAWTDSGRPLIQVDRSAG